MQGGLKENLDLVQNIMSIGALLIGGAWTYYRFIKGRLFSPKVELSMEHVVAATPDASHHIVFCDVCLRNLGSIQLLLGRSEAKCFLVEGEGELTQVMVFEKKDIVRYEDDPPEGEYYVDPGENTYRQFRFLVPASPPALLVSVRLMYNRVHMVDRKFAIINEPTSIRASNTAPSASNASN